MNINLKNWKEWAGQLEVLRTYYARLSDRERMLVLGSIAAGVVFIMIVVYTGFLAAGVRKASRIEKSREALSLMNKLREEYKTTEEQVQKFDRMIRASDPSFHLATHLERLAQKNGVSIDSLKEQPAPMNDLYKESQVTVSVRQTTLRTLINFLFEIESSQELMRVTSLQVRPNFQDPTLLSAKFVVSTFQPAGQS